MALGEISRPTHQQALTLGLKRKRKATPEYRAKQRARYAQNPEPYKARARARYARCQRPAKPRPINPHDRARRQAIASGLKRYFGQVCPKHPELKGERRIYGTGRPRPQCVGCYREQRPTQRKAYRARQRERAVRQAVPIRSFDFCPKRTSRSLS